MVRISKANLKRIERGELPIASEEEVQRVIVDGLRMLGYITFVTSRKWKRCHQCGAYGASGRGDGCTRGLADLIVRKASWPRGVGVMLECKRAGKVKWSSNEQRLAAMAGDVVVVQSIEDAAAVMQAVVDWIGTA